MSRFKEQRALINKLSQERMEVCRACPHFNKLKMCGKCNCIMPIKTKIPNAKCPIGKW